MGWIVGIAVVLLFIWLMVVSPGFRGFVFLLALLIAGGIWWFVGSQQEKSRLASELITPAEVHLSDVSLWSRDTGSHKITGKIKNLSASHALSRIRLRLVAYDCPAEALTSDCEIIGETTVSPLLGVVPAGQVRSYPLRCSQIAQVVIRFGHRARPSASRDACPVAQKAILENRESNQAVIWLADENFRLGPEPLGAAVR